LFQTLHERLAEIVDSIERARQLGSPIWPLNEADTERLVIEPVLRAIGYAELDYRKRAFAAGANFPDYTVLPASDQQWVLEAKEWDCRLDTRCERQAVNYANNCGAQWAVLTNGRVWWIYNTRVNGDLSQQRVYDVPDIYDVELAAQVLSYLSRDSVLGGEIDKAYRAREIRLAVAVALRSSRKVISALRAVVGSSLDRHITNDEIAAALGSLIDAEPTEQEQLPHGMASIEPHFIDEDIEVHGLSLAAIEQDWSQVTGRKPIAVCFGDSDFRPAGTWRELVVAILQATDALGRVSIPFKAGPRADRYFINTDPCHSDGRPMKAPTEILFNGSSLYIEMHYSALNLMAILAAVLHSASIDTACCVVKIAGESSSDKQLGQ
jgi:hypothetical protein